MHEKKFLTISKDIFNWVWKQGWDTSVCGGGVWFDNNYNGKETIENVQMIQLGFKLARLSGTGCPMFNDSIAKLIVVSLFISFTGDSSCKKRAVSVWNWILKAGIINMTSFQVQGDPTW